MNFAVDSVQFPDCLPQVREPFMGGPQQTRGPYRPAIVGLLFSGHPGNRPPTYRSSHVASPELHPEDIQMFQNLLMQCSSNHMRVLSMIQGTFLNREVLEHLVPRLRLHCLELLLLVASAHAPLSAAEAVLRPWDCRAKLGVFLWSLLPWPSKDLLLGIQEPSKAYHLGTWGARVGRGRCCRLQQLRKGLGES